MTLEEKIREIIFRNTPAIADDDGGEMAGEFIEDTTKDLMEMLRKGKYV